MALLDEGVQTVTELSREALLRARSERYGESKELEREVLYEVVTFRRGDSRYGLKLTDLREIRPLPPFCRLPFASHVVPGVVHYRGELLSLHDLAAFTEGKTRAALPAFLLVTEHKGKRIGLMADDVLEVVDVEAENVQSPPVTLGDASDILIHMTVDGVLIVDAARMFETPRFLRAF